MNESQEAEKCIKFVNSLNLQFTKKPEEFGYNNPVKLLLNVALSINRPYNRFVIPRIEFFKAKYPNTKDLTSLKNLILETVRKYLDEYQVPKLSINHSSNFVHSYQPCFDKFRVLEKFIV